MGRKISLAQFSKELALTQPYKFVLNSEEQPAYRATDPLVAAIEIDSIRIWPQAGLIELDVGGGKVTLHRVKEVEMRRGTRRNQRTFDIHCMTGIGAGECVIVRIQEK